MVFVKTKNKKLNIYIVPGLKQSNPPDVMRGEETQSLGCIKKYNNVVNQFYQIWNIAR